MQNKKILIIGGDKRLQFLHNSLKKQNYDVEIIFNNSKLDKEHSLTKINDADVLILPIPVSGDKKHLFAPNYEEEILITELAKHLNHKHIVFLGGEHSEITCRNGSKTFNLLNDENMTIKNAMATAEAAIGIVINETDFTIFNSNIIILGYGRIGKILADYLSNLHANVFVCARKSEQRTLVEMGGHKAIDFKELEETLKTSDIVINTVPSLIMDKNMLNIFSKEKLIIDLASKPGGVDFEYAKKLGIKTIHALSLPGKYSPKSAAEYIEQTIKNTLLKERFYER